MCATCLRAICPNPPPRPSSFVRFSGGTSETPTACFLHSSFFHPGKPPRSPTEDEGRRRGGELGHDKDTRGGACLLPHRVFDRYAGMEILLGRSDPRHSRQPQCF